MRSTNDILAEALLLVVLATACTRDPRPAARPTSAEIIAAGSPELRTADDTGFAHPSGQTREVSAGAGPSTVGRGDGVAPPRHEEPAREESRDEGGERGERGEVAASPAPIEATEFVGRVARAACDREAYCGRIGIGRAFESNEACAGQLRARIDRALGSASCDEVRGDRMVGCLASIQRDASCKPAGDPFPTSQCAAPAVCGSRP